MTCIRRWTVAIVAVATLTAAAPRAIAHDAGANGNAPRTSMSSEQHAFGVEGDRAQASRTITISMDDTMQYSPSEIRVGQGETVTFVVSNNGKLMHELVLGTEEGLNRHALQMRKNPEMEHDEPYMTHVKPGATGTMTWKFTNAGTFLYGCLVAGHFEAGMKGRIVVAARR
jgi:uncharacterized cupredoxin-like copper-binding protein